MPNLKRLCSKFYVLMALGFAVCSASLGACEPAKVIVDRAGFETTTKRVDEPPIAKIKGTYLYSSDVSRHAQAQDLIAPGEMLLRTDPRFDTALQELIDQRLLALGALERDIHMRGSVQRRVSLARERILSSAALEDHIEDTVTEASIRAAYDRQVQLGRKTNTFENSRDKIGKMLTAGEVKRYLTDLRQTSDIEVFDIPDSDMQKLDIQEGDVRGPENE